ncbi:hypothetical protein ACWEN3_37470 [Streptomyces sp. NPDC004561]
MRKALPLALAGLLALSACQAAGHDDASDGSHRLNSMEALPLHAYLPDPSSAEGKTLARAQWILAKRCMVRLGFSGFATLDTRALESTYPVRQGSLTGGGTVGDDSPYGVDDPDQAARQGYRNRTPEQSSQPQQWPADQYTALTGTFEHGDSRTAHGRPVPEGGCLGRATRTIYGAPPRATKVGGVRLTGYYAAAMQLWYRSHEEARKDPAWKKAEHAWSACMMKKGFSYSDPDKASVDLDWYKTEKPSGKEKRTAAADARCKLDTGYIEAAHAVESRAQKKAVRRNKADLDALRAAYARAVKNSGAIAAKES